MCIRITKELKHVYENDMRIDLGRKIFYPTFCEILTKLGYLDKSKLVKGHARRQFTSPSNNPLV